MVQVDLSSQIVRVYLTLKVRISGTFIVSYFVLDGVFHRFYDPLLFS